jgi:alginate O-acetyltransferase complex protein AlgI
MVFGSFSFIFLFLPVTVAGFFIICRKNKRLATGWLILASLFFYGWWDYRFLPILLASILFNYSMFGRIICADQPTRKRWLTLAVIINLTALCYFKYSNFFILSINDLAGGNIPLLNIILPIGISFFTFTQISFLVDAYYDKVKSANFIDYVLFTSYFPYIVSGPILHHKEMLPQFADTARYGISANNVAAGIAIFVFGLAKKLLIADNLASVVDPVFASHNPQLIQAWLGLLAYSFQLYFDFSGYSDMAIGVSRIIGFQLPINFNSPYKADNISDFWQRWHISLSRFLRNYLYIPLGGNRHGSLKRYRNLMLTMLLGGLWHGASWTFVIWGGLHGFYLCVQHGWQFLMAKKANPPSPVSGYASRVLTFFAVMIAWCFFRAANVASAMDVLAGMAGMNGVSLVFAANPVGYAMLAAGAFIAFYLPNTNEIFLYFDSWYAKSSSSFSHFRMRWTPGLRWGIATGLIFALCILSMDRTSDFIYAQF